MTAKITWLYACDDDYEDAIQLVGFAIINGSHDKCQICHVSHRVEDLSKRYLLLAAMLRDYLGSIILFQKYLLWKKSHMLRLPSCVLVSSTSLRRRSGHSSLQLRKSVHILLMEHPSW